MPDWWDGDPREQYWCEFTDRPDPGTDLKCPKTRENGKRDWSYDLILQVQRSDIVFHYSTRAKAFDAASVAGGPVEARDISTRSTSATCSTPRGRCACGRGDAGTVR